MTSAIRILHLEDNLRDAELVAAVLSGEGIACETMVVQTTSEFEKALAESDFDLILSDYTLPRGSGLCALAFARKEHPRIPFIFVSGTIGEEAAIHTLKAGATDYVLEDRLTRLGPAVRRALKDASERADKERTEAELREKAALLDLTHDAIIVHDLAGVIRFWNKGAEQLFVWSQAEALGQNISELLFEKEQQVHWGNVVARTLESGHWRGELNERSKDNRKLVVDARLTLVADPKGRPRAMLFLNTDITEKTLLYVRV